MKRFTFTVLLCATAFNAYAQNTQCLTQKYNTYIDASLDWYKSLVTITTQEDPSLDDVGQWFYQERSHHFELNRSAVDHYLVAEPKKVATGKSVEAWLQLSQTEIKELSTQKTPLGMAAALSFADRQAPPHQQNYQFRSALAELLSHPDKISAALKQYNSKMRQLSQIQCQ